MMMMPKFGLSTLQNFCKLQTDATCAETIFEKITPSYTPFTTQLPRLQIYQSPPLIFTIF